MPQMWIPVLSPSHPTLQVLTVDARNHGDSPHSPDMSYEAMSQDLQDLLPKLGLVPCVLIGHSMGGKTAMLLALQRPELVERLVAVDISPVETTSSSDFPAYMAAMKAIDIPNEMPRSCARKLADKQLSSLIQVISSSPWIVQVGICQGKSGSRSHREPLNCAPNRTRPCGSSCSPTWWRPTGASCGG